MKLKKTTQEKARRGALGCNCHYHHKMGKQLTWVRGKRCSGILNQLTLQRANDKGTFYAFFWDSEGKSSCLLISFITGIGWGRAAWSGSCPAAGRSPAWESPVSGAAVWCAMTTRLWAWSARVGRVEDGAGPVCPMARAGVGGNNVFWYVFPQDPSSQQTLRFQRSNCRDYRGYRITLSCSFVAEMLLLMLFLLVADTFRTQLLLLFSRLSHVRLFWPWLL